MADTQDDLKRPSCETRPAERQKYWIVLRKALLFIVAIGVVVLAQPLVLFFVIGCAFVGVGLLVRIWTFGHLYKNQVLVTSGPYAHCRNPAYLGSALIGAGLFVAAGNPFTWLGLGIWAVGVLTLVVFFTRYLPRKYRIEYTRLERSFGEPAREYARHVPHFWPRWRAWPGAERQRFCWSQVGANHEWGWLTVFSLALALMWIV